MDENKEFDGIKQDDNALPPWWTWFFLICIIFAVGYASYFPFSNWHMQDRFLSEVKAHNTLFPPKEALKALPGGENPLRGKTEAIAKGEKTFKTICAACHGQDAKGVVGPSLVDAEWIHGTTDGEIFNVVMNGVNPPNTKLNKGPMPAHKASLGSEKVYQVLAWLAKKNTTLLPKKAAE